MSVPITELDRKGQSKNIKLKSPEGSEHDMSLYEISRWCTMVDAVQIIDRKLADLNMSNSSKWVKPIAIQKYIDEKYQDNLHEMIERDRMLD